MSSGTEICVVCAWRRSCQKKFSLSGKDMRCADFVKDVALSSADKKDDEQESSSRPDAGGTK